ncbi:unnamed protein product [Chrysoparadoxa australica]
MASQTSHVDWQGGRPTSAVVSSKQKPVSSNSENWDDSAILRAFDDALRRDMFKEEELKEGNGNIGNEGEEEEEEYAAADARFSALLNHKHEGVPGPWEPVKPAAKKPARSPQETSSQYEYQYQAPAAGYSPGHWAPPPANGAQYAAGTSAADPHAAAAQVTQPIQSDELSDMLMAWYYSGYYTGRYQAQQEAKEKAQQWEAYQAWCAVQAQQAEARDQGRPKK